MELVLARSKAGHDKGKLYIVVGRTEDCVLLCNGVNKKAANPKKKKNKHIQLMYNLPKEVKALTQSLKTLTDPDMKKILEICERSED